MTFDPCKHLMKHQTCKINLNYIQHEKMCEGHQCELRMHLKKIRKTLEKKTAILPLTYKSYFFGANQDNPDCLYFCITSEIIKNIWKPVDKLLGSVLPDSFYIRNHIVTVPHMQFKIISPTEHLIKLTINIKHMANMIKAVSCSNEQYLNELERHLAEYMQYAFPTRSEH